MHYSTDYRIREWQGRYDEINKILYDIHKEMEFYIVNEECRLASILGEYERKLQKRKRMIENYFDRHGVKY